MVARVAPYQWPNPYDDYLPQVILSAKKDMNEVDDDRLYICVGPTGSGKSMLSFHMLHIFCGDAISIDYLAGTRETFARRIKEAKDKFQRDNIRGLPLWFDEADSDNMEQNAKWNKKLFALYMKIRFLQFFHIWCWPSLKAVDKRFVEERVNGVFFCYTKEKDKPRRYAFFPKHSILRMLEEEIPLNYQNLRKHKEKYAAWLGYFRDYNGPLKKEYLSAKHDAGFDTVDDFFDMFAGSDDKNIPNDEKKTALIKEKGLFMSQAVNLVNLSLNTMREKRNMAVAKGLIEHKEKYTEEEWKYIASITRKTVTDSIRSYVNTPKSQSLLGVETAMGAQVKETREEKNPEATETTEAE